MKICRKLLVALVAASVVAPFSICAQPIGKIWKIGFISPHAPLVSQQSDPGTFLQGMQELGYVEGKHFLVEWRLADGKYERLRGFAAELVNLHVDVIVATPSPAIRAAQQATTTIPIVMAGTGDPVSAGFVASLARPGGNITGLSNGGGEVSSKHLELLSAMVPRLSRIAVLGNPNSATYLTILKNIGTLAEKRSIKVLTKEARTPDEIEREFSSLARDRVDGLIIAADSLMTERRKQIADLALKYRLPSIYGNASYTQAGGLIAYAQQSQGAQGPNIKRAAYYVDKIIRGEKPGNIPVEQPTKFELSINKRTAKVLGVAIPQSLLVMADQVVE